MNKSGEWNELIDTGKGRAVLALSVLGAGASVVGVSNAARAAQDVVASVREYRRPEAPKLTSGFGYKPGDILLTGYPDQFNKAEQLVMGHPTRHHAYLVTKHPYSGGLSSTSVTNMENQAVPGAGRKRATQHIWRKGVHPSELRTASKKWRSWNARNAKLRKKLPLWTMLDNLKKAYHPKKYTDFTGWYEVLRPKKELSPAEVRQLHLNLRRAGATTFDEASVGKTGILNTLKGYLPIKNRSRTSKLPDPKTCAGGVCNVYRGIRKMPHGSRALPADLARSPDFKVVAKVGRRGAKALSKKTVLKHMLSKAALHLGIGGAALTAGAFAFLPALSVLMKEKEDKVREVFST